MSSSVHIDNIVNSCWRTTKGLDETILTAEDKYPINFTQSGKKFVLSLHYNGSNSFLFVNFTKIYQFQTNLFSYIKMGKETLTFGNIEIEKNKFYCHKNPNFLKDIDIEKVLVSNKIYFGEKQYKYLSHYM